MKTLQEIELEITKETDYAQSYFGKSKEKIFQRAIKEIFVDRKITHDRSVHRSGHDRTLLELLDLSKGEKKTKVYELLNHLCKSNCFDLIDERESWLVIKELCRFTEDWIRKPSDWKRPSRNSHKQLSHLIRFLLCKYPVPEFMDSAWISRSEFYKQWFIDLGNGKNLKNSQSFPEWMTKKMVHNFCNAPSNIDISQGLRYAQVKTLGGDERLALTLDNTRLPLNGEDFCMITTRLFCGAAMLDPAHVGPMVDYLLHIKSITPPDRFTMKGRTIEAVYRESEDWHYFRERVRKEEQIARARAARAGGGVGVRRYGSSAAAFVDYSWPKINSIKSFTYTSKNKLNKSIYTIDEITSTKGLRDEGSELCHCVFTYHSSCKQGVSSIWSFRVNGFRTLTIELRPKSFTIVQVRGFRNRRPDDAERRLIMQWAQQERLTFNPNY